MLIYTHPKSNHPAILVLAYDASFYLQDEWLDLSEWMSAEKPKSALLVCGALFEYLTCISHLAYFLSYFHDLASVRLVVISQVEEKE
jgi:hypothetical protein